MCCAGDARRHPALAPIWFDFDGGLFQCGARRRQALGHCTGHPGLGFRRPGSEKCLTLPRSGTWRGRAEDHAVRSIHAQRGARG